MERHNQIILFISKYMNTYINESIDSDITKMEIPENPKGFPKVAISFGQMNF